MSSASREPRTFASESDVTRIGQGFFDRTLPVGEWTHEAHFAATTWLIRQRPDVDLDVALPGLIRRFNEATGGENTDTSGYHETLTRFWLATVRGFVLPRASEDLLDVVNALVRSELTRRDAPLRFWRRETMLSTEARRCWVAPDLGVLWPDAVHMGRSVSNRPPHESGRQ